MKNFFLIALATVVFASCTESATPDLLTPATPQSTATPDTRAINDIFKVEQTGDFWIRGRVDFQGNLYTLQDGFGYDLNNKELFYFPMYKINYFLPNYNRYWATDWCLDNKGNFIIVGTDGGYGYVYMFPLDMSLMVDLTPYFPSDLYALGVCVAENGNIFVRAEGDTFERIYCLDADNGEVEEVVVGIESSSYYDYTSDNMRLMKMKGDFVGGQCRDGRLFKANTNTGEIEYITPRKGSCYRTATNMSNFYTIDNYRIIEIRPNMTTDLVIGTIPRSYIDENDILNNTGIDDYDAVFSVNADATVFYVSCYKLTLK